MTKRPRSSTEAVDAAKILPPFELRIARTISWALHPFLVAPVALTIILYLDGIGWLGAFGWAALCAAIVVVPVSIAISYKLTKNQLSDADVSVRQDRHGFYALGAACLMACYFVLLALDAPRSLQAVYASGMATIIVFALATRFWTKVSIHTGVLAGMTVAAAYFSTTFALILLGCTIAVVWSRLSLRRHSAIEVISGLVLATGISLAVMSTYNF